MLSFQTLGGDGCSAVAGMRCEGSFDRGFGDHLVEVLILDAGEWLVAKVIDDQKIDAGEFGKLSLEAVGGSGGGVDLGEHPGGVANLKCARIY